jgi:hypothetical protein
VERQGRFSIHAFMTSMPGVSVFSFSKLWARIADIT